MVSIPRVVHGPIEYRVSYLLLLQPFAIPKLTLGISPKKCQNRWNGQRAAYGRK